MIPSSFNPDTQNEKIESKIVVALERISAAFRVLLWNESKETGLSPIQIQILIFIRFHNAEQCKVSYLADEFNLTKATISDSIRLLLEKKLITKQIDANDTRSYFITLTPEGKKIAKKAAAFSHSIEKPIEQLSAEQKSVLLNSLLSMIIDLNKAGIITIQRMCMTCSYYQQVNGKHFCKLLNTKLAEPELRVDCPEHEMSFEN